MYTHYAREVRSSDPRGYSKATLMLHDNKFHSRASCKARYNRTHLMINRSFSSINQKLSKLQCYKVATAQIALCSNNKLQALNKMIITYECSHLPRRKLDHRILHEQAHPLLGEFCLPGFSYDQGEPAKAKT